MLCDLCLGDLDAKLGDQWEVEVDKPVKSQNYYRNNRFSYTNDVDKWERELADVVARNSIWAAELKRRCIFTRLMGPGAHRFDMFNLYGGLKSVVDALVRLNVLVDDDPRWFEGYARQQRHAFHGIRIRIADLLPR